MPSRLSLLHVRANPLNDKNHLESYYKSAAEIWQTGCAGAVLEELDRQKFVTMARSRFHTFQLSISHSQIVGNGVKVDALIRGLALELQTAPGLADQWFDSEFSEDNFGLLVNAAIDQLGVADTAKKA